MAAIINSRREKTSLSRPLQGLQRDWPIESLSADGAEGLWRPTSTLNVKMATLPHLSGPGGWFSIPFITLEGDASSWSSIDAEPFDLPPILEQSLQSRLGRIDVSETRSESEEASSESSLVKTTATASSSSSKSTPVSPDKAPSQVTPRKRGSSKRSSDRPMRSSTSSTPIRGASSHSPQTSFTSSPSPSFSPLQEAAEFDVSIIPPDVSAPLPAEDAFISFSSFDDSASDVSAVDLVRSGPH